MAQLGDGWRDVESVPVVARPRGCRLPSGSADVVDPRSRVASEWRTTLLSASFTIPSRCAVTSAGRFQPTASRTQLDVDHRVVPELLGQRGQARRRATAPPSSSGRRPKMKLRMSRIGEMERVDRPLDARGRLGGVLVHQLGHVLEREADGIDVLDDAVVEVLADPLALLDDGQRCDLLVQPGVLHRDPGVAARRSRRAPGRPR